MFLNQPQIVAWKRKWPPIGLKFFSRISLWSLLWPKLHCHNDVEILIAVKSDRVCSTPFAVLCFSWNEITPKWITKEKGKVLLWAEVHNLRCRYVNNDCNYCKGSRYCLCWLQNRDHCPWPLTIPVAAYLVANQQVRRNLVGYCFEDLYTVNWLAKAKWETSSLMIAD